MKIQTNSGQGLSGNVEDARAGARGGRREGRLMGSPVDSFADQGSTEHLREKP